MFSQMRFGRSAVGGRKKRIQFPITKLAVNDCQTMLLPMNSAKSGSTLDNSVDRLPFVIKASKIGGYYVEKDKSSPLAQCNLVP
jgi:hypothetical protein